MLEMHKHSIFFLLTVLTLEGTNPPPQTLQSQITGLNNVQKMAGCGLKPKTAAEPQS